MGQGMKLEIAKCPHCGVDTPNMSAQGDMLTNTHQGKNRRRWVVYVCNRCGGAVLTGAQFEHNNTPVDQIQITEMYPEAEFLDESIPERARHYLGQAGSTKNAPSASIMVSASAVDAMLKAKGYKDGSLHRRIEKAASDNLITKDMASWAHQVRLEANDERHADENQPLPTLEDATQCYEFASTLAMVLFVLPARVTRGIEETNSQKAN